MARELTLAESLHIYGEVIPKRTAEPPKNEKCPECDDATYYVGGVCAGCGYCDHCQRPG